MHTQSSLDGCMGKHKEVTPTTTIITACPAEQLQHGHVCSSVWNKAVNMHTPVDNTFSNYLQYPAGKPALKYQEHSTHSTSETLCQVGRSCWHLRGVAQKLRPLQSREACAENYVKPATPTRSSLGEPNSQAHADMNQSAQSNTAPHACY
jgi:hypothetical protein